MDECKSDNHGCEHRCVNKIGGYECECNIGYSLRSDGKTCQSRNLLSNCKIIKLFHTLYFYNLC